MTEETVAPEDLNTTQVQQLLAEIAAKDAAARNIGANPGDTIYDQEIVPGATISRKQGRAMITLNGMPLPDRVPIWERLTGRRKNVSTTLLGKKLAIMAVDGKPQFVADQALVEAPETEFIDETCAVCLRNSGNQVRKKFIHKWDYVGHMETFHPREWRVMEGESRLTPDAIFKALREMTPEERQVILGGSNGSTTTSEPQQGTDKIPCPDCGKRVKPRGLTAHQQRYCSAAAVGSGAN